MRANDSSYLQYNTIVNEQSINSLLFLYFNFLLENIMDYKKILEIFLLVKKVKEMIGINNVEQIL